MVKTKAVPLNYIPKGYLDGTCLKFKINKHENHEKYGKFYCNEENIIIYYYEDSNCTIDEY